MDAVQEAENRVSGNLLGRIRATNYLQHLGTDKSRAALQESSRVGEYGINDWIFWIVFALFDVPDKPGYMPTPYIGGMSPAPPEEPEARKLIPRFPLILVKGIPFYVTLGGGGISGRPETLREYLERLPKSTLVRSAPLRPADDPFQALDELVRSREWELAFKDYTPGDTKWATTNLLHEVLELVRTAYPSPSGEKSKSYPKWEDFERHHQAFLKLGARWDEKEQCYVRRDGSHEKIEPLQAGR
jgi:hypothetical protein